MPVYMRYLGVEAFGLVGFYFMLQAWIQLLDMGFSSTLSREMSLYRAGALDVAVARQRLRSLEWSLGLLALFALTVLMLSKNVIATRWLNFEHLSSSEVADCVEAMALAAVLRWLMGLYRSGLIGLERQMWAIVLSALFSTLKFVGVMPLLIWWSAVPLTFFRYQALVGVLEFLAFVWVMYRALPCVAVNPLPSWNVLRTMLPMAGSMAFMAAMWVFLTQIDKLILSRLLPLKEYGYFTLAVTAAGGVLLIMTPLNQVLQPRMTILASQGRECDLCDLYRQVTQLVTAVCFALGGTLALFAKTVLFAWTGDVQASQAAAPILFWYGLSNALICVLLMPFMLQFAHGYLRLHVIGNIIMGLTLLPLLVFVATRFGGMGAGATLLGANLLFLILWVPRVHRRLLPDMVWTWPLRDVGLVAMPTIGFLVLAHLLPSFIQNRLISIFMVGVIFLGALLTGLLTGDRSRSILAGWIGKST